MISALDAPQSTMADSSGKLAANLHNPHTFITGHDKDKKAIVISHGDFKWEPYHNQQMAFSVPYTTSTFPPDLNQDVDVEAHKNLLGKGTLGLVNPKGTVLRCVDFAPGYAAGMHRTQSLDYGIVMEGEVDMLLDSGEIYHLKRGDVAVQRATQHQ